jgi:hypothetical protein
VKRSIFADTGYWIALINPRDQFGQEGFRVLMRRPV